jgi:REP element-mobilizing transposase RayT
MEKNFKCNPESYYHITSRSINKDWFSMDLDEVWKIMENYLYLSKICFDIQIFGFVLMNNHFHLLVRAPKGNLSEAMGSFLRNTSLEITKNTNRINNLWAKRFKRCELNSYHYFTNTYKYIYQNPIRAGICSDVLDYRHSTLNGLLGLRKMIVPVEYDSLLFDSVFPDSIGWLNQIPDNASLNDFKKGIKKKKFKLPKTDSRPNRLESKFL